MSKFKIHICLTVLIIFLMSISAVFAMSSTPLNESYNPTIVQDNALQPMSSYYVGNSNSGKFHYPDCRWAKKISDSHLVYFDSREEAVDAGYIPCKVCRP